MSNEDYDVLAEAYADYECGFSKHKGKKLQQLHEDKILEFIDVVGFLSEHCIIETNSKLKEIYDCYKQHEQVTDKKGLHEAMLIARGSMAAMRDVFGEKMFNE